MIKSLSFEVKEGKSWSSWTKWKGRANLLRLDGPTPALSGKVLFNGQEVQGGSKDLLRAMGIVFQSPSLDQLMSARET